MAFNFVNLIIFSVLISDQAEEEKTVSDSDSCDNRGDFGHCYFFALIL